MTVQRIGLATHKGDSVVGRSLNEATDRRLKHGFRSHWPIQGVTVLVVLLLTSGSTAQFLAEEEVANPVGLEGRLHVFAIELRSVPRVRIRANIDYELDLLAGKEP